MSNIYTNKIKNIIEEYSQIEKDIAKQIKSNNNFYSATEAKKQNATLIERSESEYARAVSAINSVFREVRAKLANCTKLHSADLSENQAKNSIGFFNGEYPIKLTVDDINAFIDEFQSNFTMLRIISDYIDKNFADDVTTTATLKTKILSPRGLCEKYKAICQSAINQIGAIHGNPSTNVSFEVMPATLEIIGTGDNILSVSTANPPTVFDDIVLIREYANTFEELK